jgi:hypothetical protein
VLSLDYGAVSTVINCFSLAKGRHDGEIRSSNQNLKAAIFGLGLRRLLSGIHDISRTSRIREGAALLECSNLSVLRNLPMALALLL